MTTCSANLSRQAIAPESNRRELIPIFLAAGLLVWQLFLPGFIGMANNGDFGKVAGRLCIGGDDNGGDNFLFFKSDYIRAPRFCLVYGPPSSEFMLAWTASAIERRAGNPATFDIRWLGGLHALLWMGGVVLLLRMLRPLHGVRWWAAALAALWIFADVVYVSYLNSFFMDAAAILGTMAMLPAAVLLLEERTPRLSSLAVFGAGALLFVSSKGQHGLPGLLTIAVPLAVWARKWKSEPGSTGLTAAAAPVFALAVALLAADLWVLVETPYYTRNLSRFSLIFFKLLPSSPAPASDAAALGLFPEDLQYMRMHSFSPSSPAQDPRWMLAFTDRGDYAALLKFYLRHPVRTAAMMWRDLKEEGSGLRASNLSNYRRQDGHPPGALDHRMASWSGLRSWLLAHWPAHIIVWYGAVLLGAPLLALRDPSRFRRGVLWTAAWAALMGVAEFCVASLCDAGETGRHLHEFHLLTDWTLFLGAVYLLVGRTPSSAPDPPVRLLNSQGDRPPHLTTPVNSIPSSSS